MPLENESIKEENIIVHSNMNDEEPAERTLTLATIILCRMQSGLTQCITTATCSSMYLPIFFNPKEARIASPPKAILA